MLGDVLAAALPIGLVRVATADADGARVATESGAEVVADPGGGQGPAVVAALDGVGSGGILIVNADVPCAVPDDLRALLAATPARGLALVEALDGTTNALSIFAATLFEPLYGRDSAFRFRDRARELGVESASVPVANLADDVDTIDDLRRLHLRLGPRSQLALSRLPMETVG